MAKKAITATLALVLALSIFTVAASAASVAAKPTSSTVLVNGVKTDFKAYHINGNNYFKLRDLAYKVNGTEKEFEVGWDSESKTISLTSGMPYTPDGSEMESKGSGDKKATPTISKITLDGETIDFDAYHIEGNNYFKLRDIGEAFDFGVDWDGAQKIISIDTSKPYTPDTDPVEWKELYLAEMQAALAYDASMEADGYSGEDHDPDGRYPLQLSGFMLADLNFDGVPELMILGDTASAADMMRIFTISENKVEMFFTDWHYSLHLGRKTSDGSLAYKLICANGENESLGGSIYLTDSSTPMDSSFAQSAKKADFLTPYFDDDPSYVPVWIFDGESVSESEYDELMAGLFFGYTFGESGPLSVFVWDLDTSVSGLRAFLDSYVPES